MRTIYGCHSKNQESHHLIQRFIKAYNQVKDNGPISVAKKVCQEDVCGSKQVQRLLTGLRLSNSSEQKIFSNRNEQPEANQENTYGETTDRVSVSFAQMGIDVDDEETPFFRCMTQPYDLRQDCLQLEAEEQKKQSDWQKENQGTLVQPLIIDKTLSLENEEINITLAYQSLIESQSTKDSVNFLYPSKLYTQNQREKNALFLRQNRFKEDVIKPSQKRMRMRPLKFWIGQRWTCEKGLSRLRKARQIVDFFIDKESIEDLDYHTTYSYSQSEIKGLITLPSGTNLKLKAMNASLKYKISSPMNIFQEKDILLPEYKIIIKEDCSLFIRSKAKKSFILCHNKSYNEIINKSLQSCTIRLKIHI